MVKLVKYVTVIVGMMLVAGMLPITAFAQAAPAVARCPAARGCGGAPAPLIGTAAARPSDQGPPGCLRADTHARVGNVLF